MRSAEIINNGIFIIQKSDQNGGRQGESQHFSVCLTLLPPLSLNRVAITCLSGERRVKKEE
jgi:hypothetical protein